MPLLFSIPANWWKPHYKTKKLLWAMQVFSFGYYIMEKLMSQLQNTFDSLAADQDDSPRTFGCSFCIYSDQWASTLLLGMQLVCIHAKANIKKHQWKWRTKNCVMRRKATVRIRTNQAESKVEINNVLRQ